MDPKITQEILDDLIPSLEALEAKSTAVLEFLKHEGIASDEKLAPYLEQAANASNVRWLGVRVRVERLLSAAEKDSAEKRTAKEEKKPEPKQIKPDEASQSGSDAGDNSMSAGPESQSDNSRQDKNVDAKRVDGGSTTTSADSSTKNDSQPGKNGDRTAASEDKSKSAAPDGEQKVA